MKSTAYQPKFPEPCSGAKDNLRSLPMPESQAELGALPDRLSEAEARKRLERCGPNEIDESQPNPFLKSPTCFWGPIPWTIEAAVILSALARHWPNFAIILLLLLANAAVGFWEGREANNDIDALKVRLAIKARVLHDGKCST